MHEEFWLGLWERNHIGFHQRKINPFLIDYWPRLQLAAGSRVLVPLCGKSLDMTWLLEQGHRVLGVELAQKAVEDFFAEQQLQAEIRQQGAFRIYRAGALELWCGDFFALNAADVADCVACYDRAALIALPETLRGRYKAHLRQILPHDCQSLLVTLDYPQEERQGPPFAVPDEVVRRGYAGWRIELLEEQDAGADALGQNGRLSWLKERVYRLHKV